MTADRDKLEEEFGNLCILRDHLAVLMARTLEGILEDTDFEQFLRREVAEHRLDPDVLDDLFGEGEGAGSSYTEGYTIKGLIDAWYALVKKSEQVVEALREQEGDG